MDDCDFSCFGDQCFQPKLIKHTSSSDSAHQVELLHFSKSAKLESWYCTATMRRRTLLYNRWTFSFAANLYNVCSI